MTNIGTLVLLRLEARQREIITLTGTAGTANVTAVGGLTKLATFATDLSTTAKNFVTTHAAAYLAVGVVVTCSGVKLCFKPTLLSVAITAPVITNVTSNLAGTVAHVNANNGTLNLMGETSTSLKSAQTMIKTSNKLNQNNASFKAGRVARTVSVSSIASTDTATTEYGHEDALAVQDQLVPVDFSITEYDSAGVLVPGAIIISGTTLLSNVSIENPDNDKTTFSLDLQITDDNLIGINA
jgi:hypothetical protein